MSRQELTTLLNHVPKELFHSPHTPIRRCVRSPSYITSHPSQDPSYDFNTSGTSVFFLQYACKLPVFCIPPDRIVKREVLRSRNFFVLPLIQTVSLHHLLCLILSCPTRVSSSDAGNESDASGDHVSSFKRFLYRYVITAFFLHIVCPSSLAVSQPVLSHLTDSTVILAPCINLILHNPLS